MSGKMSEKVNVLLVDDQPDKLLAYDVILGELNENLVKTSSAREALQFLLKNDVAVVLIDVCMPELDGFQLAAMIREHPRFCETAIIFISAILLSDVDRLRGYEMGAVDYVPVPVVPEVLRAKVRVFAELFRKTRELEQLNSQLERRVAERTAELELSNLRVKQSEQGRSLALAAGQMGSWDWNLSTQEWHWDEGQYRIFGIEPGEFEISAETIKVLIHSDDWEILRTVARDMAQGARTQQVEFRVLRTNGEIRWCFGTAAASVDIAGKVVRISGVTIDITDRKEAEERQILLAGEVDHRARNALAVIQSIIRLTRAESVEDYVLAIEGRNQSVVAGAYALVGFSLAWRRSRDACCRGTGAIPSRRQDQIVGSKYFVAARDRARCGTCIARTCHQCGEVWCVVVTTGQNLSRLASRRWCAGAPLEGGRWPLHHGTFVAKFWPEGDKCQRGTTTRRQGALRLGSERIALRTLDTAKRTHETSRRAYRGRR